MSIIKCFVAVLFISFGLQAENAFYKHFDRPVDAKVCALLCSQLLPIDANVKHETQTLPLGRYQCKCTLSVPEPTMPAPPVRR